MYNWFDIIVSLVLILSFITGYFKGAIKMLIGLAIIIASIVFGGKLALIILPHIANMGLSAYWANIITYLISFISIAIILTLIGNLIQKIFHLINLGFINRLIGGIVSIGISMVVMSLILNFAIYIDTNNKIITENTIVNSSLYNRVKSVVPAMSPYLNWEETLSNKEYKNILENINIESIDSSYQKRYFGIDSI